eukprot:8855-Heterococcus_DN1.PRE.1
MGAAPSAAAALPELLLLQSDAPCGAQEAPRTSWQPGLSGSPQCSGAGQRAAAQPALPACAALSPLRLAALCRAHLLQWPPQPLLAAHLCPLEWSALLELLYAPLREACCAPAQPPPALSLLLSERCRPARSCCCPRSCRSPPPPAARGRALLRPARAALLELHRPALPVHPLARSPQ